MVGDDDWNFAKVESIRRHQLDLAYQALQATISAAKKLAMVIDDLKGPEWESLRDADGRIERKLKTAAWWIDEARGAIKAEDA